MKETSPLNLEITLTSSFSFDMIYVEGGEFDMGSNDYDDEKPIHRVKVSSFYLGKYQVTQQLWQIFEKENPSYFKGENRPVEMVRWNEVQEFIKKLSKDTGHDFRLPTEAEWEYAARGGIYSQGYDYCGSDKLKQVGWYNESANSQTHDVGLMLANELGIYDMSGNVCEWCEDDYHGDYNSVPKDGSAWIDSPKRGDRRIMRGGSSSNSPMKCRPQARDWSSPDHYLSYYGFRLCLSLQSVG